MKSLIISALIISSLYAHTHDQKSLMVDETLHNLATDYEAFNYTYENQGQLFNKLNFKKNNEIIFDNPTLTNFQNKISLDYLKEELQKISGDADIIQDNQRVNIPERSKTENIKKAADYLYAQYEAYGFKRKPQTNSKYNNIIVEKLGSTNPEKVLIISSHIDSVGNAGANDDGTGTIAALSIAKALQGIQTKYTLRVIHFDAEEVGLRGSRDYVSSLSKTEINNLIGNIQLEMMGTNSRKDGVFHVVDCSKRSRYQRNLVLTNAIEAAIKSMNLGIINNPGCTTRSDHSSFWNEKVPAVAVSENFFGGDSDPCYHRSCDIVDSRIDFEYMRKITAAMYGAALRLLN